MYSAAVITVSDSCHNKKRTDLSGPACREILEKNNYNIVFYDIVPDEQDEIIRILAECCEKFSPELIITTGGTGFSSRDVTPEATKSFIEKNAPGIAEAIRSYSMTITPKAMLSRGIAGIKGKTLIINLPGSQKAVRESLNYVLPHIRHGIDILTGSSRLCGE